MSLLEPGDYYILDVSDENFVSLANSNNYENLTLQVKEPDRTLPDIIGREWKILPKMPGSDQYWIRNIRYNDTYAVWDPFPRPTQVQGVRQGQDDLTRPQMLWKIKHDPTNGFYRIYPAIDDPSFSACWNIASSMLGNFVDISTPISESDKQHSLWKFVEAEIPQACVFETSLPAVVRSPLSKLEIVFVQEMPSREPITTYMDSICRPLLDQNKIKDEDLRICLIECKTEVRDWRGLDFPWAIENDPPVAAVLTRMKRKRNWTPGALTVVIFNISTLTLKPGTLNLYETGGKDGCIMGDSGRQPAHNTPAFRGLAGLSSGIVLSIPPSNIGSFIVEARKTGDLVTLARQIKDARQWYPKAGRLLDVGMTSEELRDFESNPKASTQADNSDQTPQPPVNIPSRKPRPKREKQAPQEESDFVIVTFRNKSSFRIDLTWVAQGTQKKDSNNKWELLPQQSRVVPMPVNVRHKFFMINGQRLIKAFTRVFQEDATVELAAYYAE